MRDIAFKVHYNEEKKKNVQIKLKKKITPKKENEEKKIADNITASYEVHIGDYFPVMSTSYVGMSCQYSNIDEIILISWRKTESFADTRVTPTSKFKAVNIKTKIEHSG